MRLYICIIGIKQLLGTFDGQLLGHIHVFTATVVALARITLGVLVGQHGALCLQYTRTGVILRGNQFNVLFLAPAFGIEGGLQLVIETGNLHVFVKHRR